MIADILADVDEARRRPIPDLVIGGKALDWDDLSGVPAPEVASYVVTDRTSTAMRSGREARDGLVDHLVRHGDSPEYATRVATQAAQQHDRRGG